MQRIFATAFAACFAAAGFSGTALAEDDAVAYVKSLYAKDWPGDGARYTARLEELKAQCLKREEETGEMCMDFDFFVMAQDHDLSDLNVTLESSGEGTAKVKASFKNMDQETTVVFDLVKDGNGWAIDEMTSDCDSLSGVYRGEEPTC